MRFKPDGWTANAWAVEAGVSRTVWTDIRRHANPSRRTLEKLLVAAGSSLAEFEALRIGVRRPDQPIATASGFADGSRAWRGAALGPIPLYAAEAIADRRHGLAVLRFDPLRSSSWVDRPASLAGDVSAFALPVVDSAMRPRFRPGRAVIIVPGRKVAAGDDVLVILDSGVAAIAELVEQCADRTIVRQHQPEVSAELSPGDVQFIVGEAL